MRNEGCGVREIVAFRLPACPKGGRLEEEDVPAFSTMETSPACRKNAIFIIRLFHRHRSIY